LLLSFRFCRKIFSAVERRFDSLPSGFGHFLRMSRSHGPGYAHASNNFHLESKWQYSFPETQTNPLTLAVCEYAQLAMLIEDSKLFAMRA